ncbi:FecR family protein [Novipirellula aureliae]|nr:FecR family protein [Novipirellula aureliae]
MNDKHFDDLLAAYLEGDISAEQLSELHRIVQSSEPWKQRFQEATRVHVLLRETLVEQVELQAIQQSPTQNEVRPSRHWTYAAIAVAAILLVSATIGYNAYHPHLDSTLEIGVCMSVSGSGETLVERGERLYQAIPNLPLQTGDQVICDANAQAMVRLADGSILSMEPGARLTLVSDSPEVILQQGEAFFEIAPRRPGMPAFQIRTGHSTVAVMGTVFSLVANDHTELKVYEGSVKLTRNSDKASVEVGSQQMASTGMASFAAEKLSHPPMEILTLTPTDDVTLDRGKPEHNQQLKVEGQRRIVYLRFEIPDRDGIRSARLRLTQNIDSGTGTLRYFLGDHADWSEDNLTEVGPPKRLTKVAERKGVVQRGQIIEVDVSDATRHPGPITIIMTLDKAHEDDIWFGSRESDTPPQLILRYLPGPLEKSYPPPKLSDPPV